MSSFLQPEWAVAGGSCNLDWYAVCAVRSMACTASEVARSPKFKHLQAGNIWAFVHGKGELNYEEHNHLKRCKHCEAIFQYLAIYGECAEIDQRFEGCMQST